MNFITNIVGTEPLSVGSYIALGLVGVWAIQAMISLVYPVVITFYNIAWRKEKPVAGYQKFKYGFGSLEVNDAIASVIIIDGICFGIIAGLLLALHTVGHANFFFVLVFTLSFALSSPYILRYFIDMYKTLQMNTKTGESVRLYKLEKEIAEIKKNQTK